MADATAADAPRPSLLRRMADRMRVARAAALIRSVPASELGDGQPHPALVAPRTHAAVEAISHPAVFEFGLPAWMLLVGGWLWRVDRRSFVFPPFEGWVALLMVQLVAVMLATHVGMWIFKRRYRRMARAAYHGRQWRAGGAGDA